MGIDDVAGEDEMFCIDASFAAACVCNGAVAGRGGLGGAMNGEDAD